MRKILAVLVLSAAVFGCGLASFTAEEEGQRDFPTSEPVILDVSTFNGLIEVIGGQAGNVHIAWTRRGSGETQKEADADISNVLVHVEAKGGVGRSSPASTPRAEKDPATVRIVAKRKDDRMAWASGASFVITVPAKSPVTLRTSNGAVKVRGVFASVVGETSNGAVHVTDGAGKIDVKSSNGAIEIAGDALLVTAKTSNGHVQLKGAIAAGEHTLTSSNGAIEVTLPASAAFKLSARTSNGSVDSDFAVASESKAKKHELEGTVGANPAASLTLETSNGSIKVRQAK